MCCTSKKKPQPSPQPQPSGNQRKSKPQSKIVFDYDNLNPDTFKQQGAFGQTKKMDHIVKDHLDRNQRYSLQLGNPKQSKLIAPPSILNCQLDAWDGISRLPVVDTFHYQSVLTHCFLHSSKNEVKGVETNDERLRRLGQLRDINYNQNRVLT